MNVAYGAPAGGKPVAYLVVGDGPRDERIAVEAASKYDHTKTIVTARLPPTHRRPTRATGLKPALAEVAYAATRLGFNTVLIVIDREHIPDQRRLTEALREQGLHPHTLRQHPTGLIEVEAETNPPHPTRVHLLIAVQGWRKNIEEHLAKLIELTTGHHLEPSKDKVNRWLRAHGLRDSQLVARATRQQLEQAFPSLTHALKTIAEEDP